MKKKFKVCIASRYMYDDYREYDIYYVHAQNIENARRYTKRVVTHWNNKQNCITYELFDIEEIGV